MKKTVSKKTSRIAVIGAGKMATAITVSLVSKGVPASSVLAYDVSPAAAKKFTSATGCKTAATLADALKDASTILLAVKPQVAPVALKEAGSALRGKLLISIVAGLKLESLAALAATNRIVRVMPNTPALVQQGMTCFTMSPKASSADRDCANEILSSFGLVREVPESLLDAVTGLSGSGPAFVMEFILGLAEGGRHHGARDPRARRRRIPRHRGELRDRGGGAFRRARPQEITVSFFRKTNHPLPGKTRRQI